MMDKQLYLDSIARRCEKELDALNIPYNKGIKYEINTRAMRRWGQCRRRDGKYSININERLIDPSVLMGLKNTLMHEILHSVPNGFDHTGEWKRYAQIVNDAYGYNIKRTDSAKDKGLEPITNKRTENYVIICEDCGQRITRSRKSKLITNLNSYCCGKCGGHFKLVKGDE